MIFIQSYHWNHTENEKQNNLAKNYTFNTNADTKKIKQTSKTESRCLNKNDYTWKKAQVRYLNSQK